MTVNIFRASTQYGDMKGDVVADRADKGCPSDWLREKGHMDEGEFLVGIKLFVGENHGAHRDPVSVTFLIMELPGFDNAAARLADLPDDEPVDVRRLVVDMNITDFFALFKRFDITLSPLKEMQSRHYRYDD